MSTINQRNHLPEETVEEYITALFHPIDSCNYGNLQDKMLHDRLVVGIQDVPTFANGPRIELGKSHETSKTK